MTPEDMLKGLPFVNGWYKAEVVDATVKPSKDNGSINYVATCKVSTKEGERTIDARFNSKAIGFMKPYLAALEGLSMNEFVEKHKSGLDFEFEATKGGKLQIKIENKLFENRQVSEVNDFAPFDYNVPF